MSDWVFELPLTVVLPRKTKNDKKVSININWYRNAYYGESNEVKRLYKELIAEQFEGLRKPEGKIHVHYEYYAARDNSPDLDNFTGCAKKFFQDAMVELGFIEDDNVHFIPSTSEKYCGIDRKNPRVVAKVQELL